jgi:hypothetical protein
MLVAILFLIIIALMIGDLILLSMVKGLKEGMDRMDEEYRRTMEMQE